MGEPTLQDIAKELCKPGRDPRDELPPQILRTDAMDISSLKAGMEFVRKIGIDRIFRHEDGICRRFAAELEKSPKVTIYRTKSAEYVPIVSFSVEGKTSERVAAELAEKGFCLRAGYHCAALAHSTLGTENGTVRFSPSVFSREEDAVALGQLIIRNT